MEVCGDRVDNDCDGQESEEDANTDPAQTILTIKANVTPNPMMAK